MNSRESISLCVCTGDRERAWRERKRQGRRGAREAQAIVDVWSLEDDYQHLLSFHPVDSRDHTQISRPACQHLYLPSHLTSPKDFILVKYAFLVEMIQF